MKKALLLLVCFTLSLTTFAQQDESVFELMERTDISIQEAEQRANAIFDRIGTGRGTGYKHFQRWLYERKFHIDENGTFLSPTEEWNRYQTTTQNNFVTAGNWTELGPVTWNRTSSWNPGTGRISAMAIHPSNENIIYVGSPGGGIWKTINGGTTWTPLIDYLAGNYMSVMALAIDPNNQNTIYAMLSGNNGIIKSTNGGAGWFIAGAGPSNVNRAKILIHPTNSDIVFVATGNGIWRSINATSSGISWTQVHNIGKEDIEFKPNDVNIMYATGNDVLPLGE